MRHESVWAPETFLPSQVDEILQKDEVVPIHHHRIHRISSMFPSPDETSAPTGDLNSTERRHYHQVTRSFKHIERGHATHRHTCLGCIYVLTIVSRGG